MRPADVAREMLRSRKTTSPITNPITRATMQLKATKRGAGLVGEPKRDYEYKGYKMRSIAEARWAAFFDECGIGWQYEPISTGDYIPDFLLFGDMPTLVEVKGGATTLKQLEEQTAYVEQKLMGYWEGDVLLLGASPALEREMHRYNINGFAHGTTTAGIMLEAYPSERSDTGKFSWWAQPAIACVSGNNRHTHGDQCSAPAERLSYGFRPYDGGYRLRPWGCYDGGRFNDWPPHDLDEKWAAATNTVRYLHGGRS